MNYSDSTLIADIGLAAPAARALNGAGYQTLKDVAKTSDADLASLHGFGPKAQKQLHQALADAGLRDPVDTKPIAPGPLLARSGYVQVGDLDMYHEIGGEGEPLVMLHGGMLQSGVFYAIAPVLAEKRQVILVDQQGYGRTADVMVNRSTFYRHYLDKYDLLNQHLDELQAQISEAAFLAKKASQTSSEKVPSGLLVFVKHVQEYAGFYILSQRTGTT